jgi:hypothetical protein
MMKIIGRIVLAILIGGLTFLPLIVVVAFGLWAPAGLNHESFSLHYVSFPMLSEGYHFFRNAHFFTLLYAYVPSLIVTVILRDIPAFDKVQIFSLLIYLIQGTLLALLCWRVVVASLRPVEKTLLVFCALGSPLLTTRLINLLTINYHMLEAVLFTVLAYLLVLWLARKDEELASPRRLGVLCAVSLGTKLTLPLQAGPLFALLVLPFERGRSAVGAATRRFIAGFVVSTLMLLAVYVMFRPDYAWRLLRDLVRLNQDSRWLDQRMPTVVVELRHWLAPESLLFGFHVTVTLWALMIVGLAVVCMRRRPDRRVMWFLASNVLSATFLIYLLWRRTMPNTILDIVLFLVAQIAVLGAIYARHFELAIVAKAAVTVLVITAAVQATVYYHPLANIRGLQVATEIARQVERIQAAHPKLPVIFYQAYVGPSLIFPAVPLYNVVSGGVRALTTGRLSDDHRDVRIQKPADGPYEGPHVMIVPEYFTPPGRDAVEGWDRVAVFATIPTFQEILNNGQNECQIFQLDGIRAHVDVQFELEPTRVTACVVHEPARIQGHDGAETPRLGGRNIALGRPARQSSTHQRWAAAQAVDGRVEPDDTSMAHTQSDYQAWWEVDLGAVHPIDDIRIWNRAVCCPERLRAFHILVSERPFASAALEALLREPGVRSRFVSSPVGSPTVIRMDLRGRYVRLQLAERGVLNLPELEVWGGRGAISRE